MSTSLINLSKKIAESCNQSALYGRVTNGRITWSEMWLLVNIPHPPKLKRHKNANKMAWYYLHGIVYIKDDL